MIDAILVFTCFNIVDDLESFCADRRLFRAFAKCPPDATDAVALLPTRRSLTNRLQPLKLSSFNRTQQEPSKFPLKLEGGRS
jgi:hypothetical protein